MSPEKAKLPDHPPENIPHYMRLEATPRVELGNRGFADLGLTTWLCRQRKLSLSAFRRPNTKMATRMGLEPTISAVTGRHSKPTELPGQYKIIKPLLRLYAIGDASGI